jgi:hypothetical protein
MLGNYHVVEAARNIGPIVIDLTENGAFFFKSIYTVMRELQRMTFKTFECILGWEPMIRTRNVRSALKRFARVIRLLTKALPSGAQAGAERKLFHHRSS